MQLLWLHSQGGVTFSFSPLGIFESWLTPYLHVRCLSSAQHSLRGPRTQQELDPSTWTPGFAEDDKVLSCLVSDKERKWTRKAPVWVSGPLSWCLPLKKLGLCFQQHLRTWPGAHTNLCCGLAPALRAGIFTLNLSSMFSKLNKADFSSSICIYT